jgi:glutathione-regulated potassium-efflux system ancillary protein KefG
MTAHAEVLVLFAHPALERSRVNLQLAARARTVDGVTFRDLYELYPEFDVDVAQEQALLERHRVVVLQHPLFWYSVPALLKQWIDLVFEHGWAYGQEGRALEGKTLTQAVTVGGSEQVYRQSGRHGHSLAEFLQPFEATAKICRMRYRDPFTVHSALRLDASQIAERAEAYAAWLTSLREAAREEGNEAK